jgi:hypothetical protein
VGLAHLFLWSKEVEPVGNEKDDDSPKPAAGIAKTGSLEMRRKKEKTLDELLFGNVLPTMPRDSNVTLRIYASCIPQLSGSLKDNFLTTPSSPTMTSDRPAQK